ncbi:OPT oligopeptide transporter protein-domain-containing protein [Polychytrium aggregatum]|uniref:OPT oligopeptide transporter protein-domain-containing protein n=1 Tax=Polychytrium aggregatum TaxID=110093 RepID=UPI0022FEDA17|nr:OPT oligopeptide transporter protein-domain-containing protein [Polychytrium aggregatum]KAI9209500.1 OPT oligopeptide transporter protein-domain-containing protein [Polychytrium aggregatum]
MADSQIPLDTGEVLREKKERDSFERTHPDVVEEEFHHDEQQLTFRAIIVGVILGSIVCASNLYLGLKTGFTFGAALIGSILGFSILKPWSTYAPRFLGGGGHFGPRENCTVQTAATAAGGLALFITSVPSLYNLKLLSMKPDGSPDIHADIGRLLALTVSCAGFGLFFAIPLRKYFVIQRQLVFPTPTASAVTIKSLHTGGKEAALVAKTKSKALIITFAAAMAWTMVGYFVPGLVQEWHIFAWLYSAGVKGAQQLENWKWYLGWTPAMIGGGMLMGPNAAGSMWLGTFLAYGFIGPVLVAAKECAGSINKADPNIINYFSAKAPMPRYWLLWPGVMIMVCASFAEMGMNGKTIYRGIKAAIVTIAARFKKADASAAAGTTSEDPVPPEEQVPTWQWIVGLTISVVMAIVFLSVFFHVGVGETLLSIIVAFIFAFVAIESTGATDVNPTGAIAKTSQFIFAGVSKAANVPVAEAQRLNLVAGSLAASAAHQSCDMVGDLKTGHILRASPRSQFHAQILGSIVGVFTSLGVFLVFATAYPCIMNLDQKCIFDLPSVSAWNAITVALTDTTKAPIPASSGWSSIGLGLFAILVTVGKHYLPQKYRIFVPNMSAIGISFVLTSTHYSTAMVIGSIVAVVWERRAPKSWEVMGWAVASGMIAGEGIGGLFQAILQIAGVTNDRYGTQFGCPKLGC